MHAQPFSLRSKLLPGIISRSELERVSKPAVKQAIMGEFLGHFASVNPKVRLEAAQLTAENVGTYGAASGALWAQMPLILFASWQPLPVVLARLPYVARAMTLDNSATNYLAMEAFNAGVRAAIANGPSGEF